MSKKTLETAKRSGNNVIVQVKGNQTHLLEDCKNTEIFCKPDDFYEEEPENNRNRIEIRNATVYTNTAITELEKWSLVKAVVKIKRSVSKYDTKTKKYKDTVELSYYISTIVLSAEEFCKAIRNHWGIENSNHYVKDVSMGEDASRIRVSPIVFATLRSFALNIMRANNAEYISQERRKNSWDMQRILNYVGF